MIKSRSIHTVFTFIFIFSLSIIPLLQIQAQIFHPEGLNMPGSWDNWNNPPEDLHFAGSSQTSGGLIKLINLENSFYQTGLYVHEIVGDILPGEYQFKFTSGPMSNPWQNQWGNTTIIANTIQEYTYGVAGTDEPSHNTVQLDDG